MTKPEPSDCTVRGAAVALAASSSKKSSKNSSSGGCGMSGIGVDARDRHALRCRDVDDRIEQLSARSAKENVCPDGVVGRPGTATAGGAAWPFGGSVTTGFSVSSSGAGRIGGGVSCCGAASGTGCSGCACMGGCCVSAGGVDCAPAAVKSPDAINSASAPAARPVRIGLKFIAVSPQPRRRNVGAKLGESTTEAGAC